MPDDPDLIGQNEIEDMLQQGTGVSPPASASDPTSPTAVQQNEIDSLLKGIQTGATEDASTAATGTSAASPTLPRDPDTSSLQAADDVQTLLDQAELALASSEKTAADSPGLAPFEFQDFSGTPPSSDKATLDLLRDVELDLKIELGRTQMELEQILKLRKGSVVSLDKLAGDPVDVYVNGRLVARGEVLVLNDNFCVRVAELIRGSE